jgi:O-methyltransferase
MLNIFKFIKDFLIFSKITYLFTPIASLLNYIYYWNLMLKFISDFKTTIPFNDFYRPFRDNNERNSLYEYVFKTNNLTAKSILYMEFGVSTGVSFKKMLTLNSNETSKYYGFDTFEGLPEDWGGYKKGDMSSTIPQINDNRGHFLKGLFQDTLVDFINDNRTNIDQYDKRVIHMDADLYSATIFTLSQLYPFLKSGDIILFDEFSVPMHEFKAFKEFLDNFYVKCKPIAAVNNYYQMAFEIL